MQILLEKRFKGCYADFACRKFVQNLFAEICRFFLAEKFKGFYGAFACRIYVDFACRKIQGVLCTRTKPILSPNCMIPYRSLYMVSYSSDSKRAQPLWFYEDFACRKVQGVLCRYSQPQETVSSTNRRQSYDQ